MSAVFVNNNNTLLPAEDYNLNIDNRAIRYGDGLFETIKIMNGKIVGLDAHVDRLFKGLQALRIVPPETFSFDFFKTKIEELLVKNAITEGGRVRLLVYRASGGYFLPGNNTAEYFIEAYPSEKNLFELNPDGLTIDLYPDMRKQINQLAPYKTVNGLIYIMAAMYASDHGWDDSLLQNDKFGIIESTHSNLFIVSNGVLYTPGLDTGCIGGTMRMQLINLAIEQGIQVYESNITPQNLLVADELFLTNSINGIEWVGSYKTKRYFNTMATKLVKLLNEKYA